MSYVGIVQTLIPTHPKNKAVECTGSPDRCTPPLQRAVFLVVSLHWQWKPPASITFSSITSWGASADSPPSSLEVFGFHWAITLNRCGDTLEFSHTSGVWQDRVPVPSGSPTQGAVISPILATSWNVALSVIHKVKHWSGALNSSLIGSC